MKAIDNRIRRLQGRLCPEDRQSQRFWVLLQPGRELALDLDRCTQILDERGVLPTGRFGVVDLLGIPEHLTARELEHFLRSNAEGASRALNNDWSNRAQMASGGT